MLMFYLCLYANQIERGDLTCTVTPAGSSEKENKCHTLGIDGLNKWDDMNNAVWRVSYKQIRPMQNNQISKKLSDMDSNFMDN